jgi:ATP-dependent helicase YprA (DUF1998 family)
MHPGRLTLVTLPGSVARYVMEYRSATGGLALDIFDFRDQLVGDYSEYVRSFVHIRDPRIEAQVEAALGSGRLWPQPLLQLNPSFEPGGRLASLVEDGTLHPATPDVFRVGKSPDDPFGVPLEAHQHQIEALRIAHDGHPYVVTTGTGSGKSLTYIVPIVDHVLRSGSGKGIQAIVVYPMNALANSQLGELRKFLDLGFPDGSPVTFARYTGQDDEDAKRAIIENPPDILLTNYVMLELILTRPQERKLIEAARGLRFLVFDELHTYRGRQGADVAMLIRRVRERLGGEALQCIGTSATMSSEGTYQDKQRKVANVASKIFGVEVAEDHVIGETLKRVTPEIDLADPDVQRELIQDLEDVDTVLARGFDGAAQRPLSAWVETTFGIQTEPGTGRLVRAEPKRLRGDECAGPALAHLLGLDSREVTQAIERFLLRAGDLRDANDRPLFAFRLHQFLSKGDAIYATPEDAATRFVTMDAQRYAPGRRGEASLLPLAFCRECGHEYYTVWHGEDEDGTPLMTPRRLSESDGGDGLEPGFLYASDEVPWPSDEDAATERLPADWLEGGKNGDVRVKHHQRGSRPKHLRLDANGRLDPNGKFFAFVPAPFKFCLACGVAYPGRRNDFAKLNVFSSEGRATSTTILSLAAIQRLKHSDLPSEARKLLSFTDNRQDAALQAGHFNDFIDIGLLRGGLYRAVSDAGPDGLRADEIARKLQDVLALPFEEYALDPTVILAARRQTDDVLRGVLAYRLFQDLKRGWRINLPNLEQVGLLRIGFPDLPEAAAHEDLWRTRHPALANASPAERERIAGVLLDFMRRHLAVFGEPLDREQQEALRSRSGNRLREPWAIHEREKLSHASVLFPRSRGERDPRDYEYLSGRSAFARFLRRDGVLSSWTDGTSTEESEVVIRDLLDALKQAGLVHVALAPRDGGVPGYQVNADAMRWLAGDGVPFEDPLVRIRADDGDEDAERAAANAYFARYYREVASGLTGIRAAEHTAQVPSDTRMEREDRFRDGSLPVLYCSPTMELGVDIASLNVVNLRNVPPTPANYAQRSGRAGRSGQPAMVFTYCSTWSAHDQYFFKRQEAMVAGVVSAPRLDLGNEELVRAHVQAIWLAETGIDLGQSLRDVLDVDHDDVPLLPSVADQVNDPAARSRARERAARVLATLGPDVAEAAWFHDEWLADTLRSVGIAFYDTTQRWRDLYRAAVTQLDRQHAITRDASADPAKRRRAERLRAEARVQRDLLIDASSAMHSDFFSYRYFASEGFLPGYSFPRLPLSAYIPARASRSGVDEYVSRPRFLAVSEFGPGAVIYHDGGKYKVNRVILPPQQEGEDGVAQTVAKRCPACGYLHEVTDQSDPDRCARCDARLEPALHDLLRMQNVTTKRLERINSDEEERQRQGYEVITGYRFAVERGVTQCRTARAATGDAPLAQLDYGQAATLWRLNLGWRRREVKEDLGFAFDVEQGYWATQRELKAQEDEHLEADDDPLSKTIRKVIPFVEDRRNLLVWTPERPLDAAAMASLQAALKNAVQIEYQLEEMELAAEPLPSRDERRSMLFYEAAEGGAGVLRSLVDEPDALRRVARRALEILHFDPDTGEDLGHAPGSSERCEAACYDCMMSYGNQLDHELLDRFLAQPLLQELMRAGVEASPTQEPRRAHRERLETLCDSGLEKRFVAHLYDTQRRLPDEAQARIDLAGRWIKPDFLYREQFTLVYVDGPVHDYPDRQQRDADAEAAAQDAGWHVLRFRHYDDWEALMREHTYLFGGEGA